MIDYENNPIIAAIRSEEDFRAALNSEVETIFLLASNIMTLDAFVEEAHSLQKKLFVHMDFVDGLSKDASGVAYVATKNIDGIISTRSNIINAAKEHKITCIQRFFMIDSRSVTTALDSLRQTRPDMIEIMPGVAYKSISKIKSNTSIPIIAGGLIEHKDEIYQALAAGASVVSTGRRDLWDM